MEDRLHKKRLDDASLSNIAAKMPDATIGKCERCHQVGELGNGFCLGCWDKSSGNRKNYPDIHYKKKIREESY